MWGFIWSLIVGSIIGGIAGTLTRTKKSMGCITKILAGLIGSSIGQALLGHWGPKLAGMALVPSICGAIILIVIVTFIFGGK